MLETIISNFHIEKIMYIIRKRIALILCFVAIGGMAGGAYAYKTNETYYRAAVSFYVYSNPEYKYETSVNISSTEFALAKNLVQSYTMVLRSNTVMQKVLEATEIPYTASQLAGSVTSSGVDGTSIFYVYVYDSNPYYAMELANAIADIAPSEIARIVKSGGIEVVDYATLPVAPYSSTNMAKFVILGAAAGGVVVAAIALFFGLLDTTIRKKYELRLTFNIPILGEVPFIYPANRKSKANVILDEESPFAMKESYNALCTNMLFTACGDACPVYVVTSSEQDEGKSLTSINISKGFSNLGKRVLLIDADMRNSTLARVLSKKKEGGLSEYLAGINAEYEAQKVEENFNVICAGPIPPNPAALLASRQMAQLLNEAKENYDCIIIDSPPVGIVSDAMLLSKIITGYVFVVRMGVSKMNKMKATIGVFEEFGAEIAGMVLNGVNPRSKDYKYSKYGYEYQYGEEKNSKKRKKVK